MINKNLLLQRIIIDQNIMVGKPVIRGTRIPIKNVLEALTEGMTTEQIMEEYQLEKEDILACIAFVTDALEDMTFATVMS